MIPPRDKRLKAILLGRELQTALHKDPLFRDGGPLSNVEVSASVDHPGYLIVETYHHCHRVVVLYLHPSECVSLDAIKFRLLMDDLPHTAKEAWEMRQVKGRKLS